MVMRGEIWDVDLDPTQGSEIQKTRPCVVVSPDVLNNRLRTVIVAPMTTKGFSAPFRIQIEHREKKGLVLLDQIRAVDKSRLVQKRGTAHPQSLRQTLDALKEFFEP